MRLVGWREFLKNIFTLEGFLRIDSDPLDRIARHDFLLNIQI